MPLFPKTRFKWKEPRAFLKIKDGYEKSHTMVWYTLVWTVVAAAGMMLIWYLATLDPKKEPPSASVALLLSLFFGVFMAVILPWITRLCPSEVKVTDRFIHMARGSRNVILHWKQVTAYRLDSLDGMTVLQLGGGTGGLLIVALSDEVDAEELARFLESVGLKKDPTA